LAGSKHDCCPPLEKKRKKRKEKKRKEKKRKEKKRKEKKRKYYTFRRQFNEKPSIIPGCPGCPPLHSQLSSASTNSCAYLAAIMVTFG
jgi:hypothetical protein